MQILALDTSGDYCSVALGDDQDCYHKTLLSAREQGAYLLPMLKEALEAKSLQPSELSGIVFGHGPASFTGLRLSASVALGLALGWDKKVLTVSHLATLAFQQYRVSQQETPILVASDARKEEAYVGSYQFKAGACTLMQSEAVLSLKALPSELKLSTLPSALDILHFACYLLRAGHVWQSPADIELAYVRNKVTD